MVVILCPGVPAYPQMTTLPCSFSARGPLTEPQSLLWHPLSLLQDPAESSSKQPPIAQATIFSPLPDHPLHLSTESCLLVFAST